MPFLIDGFNLFHAAQSSLPQGFDLGRSPLMRMLGDWSAAFQHKVTVVWDGTPPPAPLAGQLGDNRLLEIYAGGVESADERIASLLNADSGARHVTVISNDREVQRSARQRGSQTMSCEAFLKGVVRDLRQGSEPVATEPEEKQRGLGSKDAHEWLTAFGFDADGPAEFEHP